METTAPVIPCPTCGGPITLIELRGMGQCDACEAGVPPEAREAVEGSYQEPAEPDGAEPVSDLPSEAGSVPLEWPDGEDMNALLLANVYSALQMMKPFRDNAWRASGDEFCREIGAYLDTLVVGGQMILDQFAPGWEESGDQ